MNPVKKFAWALLVQILLACIFFTVASADGVVAPPGFKLLKSTTGVQLYIKAYPQGSPDYVQVVDLSQGAKVVPLLGDVREPRPGQGVFGGNDPRIQMQSLSQFWRELRQRNQNAVCVTNGQFFYMRESPTRLPFPLKMDGTIVSSGYARSEFPEQKLMLELWADRAQITPLSKEALFNSSAPAIIGGLTEDANKSAKHYVGRTFVGVADASGDGIYETVLIFNTKSTNQVGAAQVLRDFGATQVMMLDGGGSTQLTCQGEDYIGSDRLIPQAIGVVGGPKKTVPNYVERASASPGGAGGPGGTESAGSGTATAISGKANATTVQAAGGGTNSGAKSKNPPGAGSAQAKSKSASSADLAGTVPQTGSLRLVDLIWVPLAALLVSAVFVPRLISRRQAA